MNVSLSSIKDRDSESLLYSVRNVRLSAFYTPSSFYLQLPDEDKAYNNLQLEMLEYYNGVSIYSYCCMLNGTTPENPALNKLKLQFLRSKMNVTIKVEGKWIRCVTGMNPRECRDIDTGIIHKLTPVTEKTGIYKLALQFLSLSPRALLCGLNGIIPKSPDGKKWTLRACKIVKHLIDDWPLRVYFNQIGFIHNSYYVFLSATCKGGYGIHVITALCAFDEAVVDTEGVLHPIWPSDTPS